MFNFVRQPLFEADGDIGGSGGNEPASSSAPAFTPTWGLPNGGGNQAAVNPLLSQAAPEQPPEQPPAETGQVFDFAGRKIEVSDPNMLAALKDVHKDYSALQGTYTQSSQRVKELEQANQTYMNVLAQMQQQQPAPDANEPNQGQPQQPSPEDLEQMKSDFMEKFYDNPLSAIEGLMDSMFQQRVQPVIEPITQERQWNEQVQQLRGKYEDFDDLIGPMQQLLQDMPDLAQHGLESVYQLTKRATPPPQPQPEQLLSDPQFVSQMMQRPEIQQQFLSTYMQDKQNSWQQAPTVMGGQAGGQAPAAPESRPKDMHSASQAFKRHLGIGN